MGLNLVRTQATVAANGNYTPNGLLSSFFELTFLGAGTINAPVAVNAGDIIAVRCLWPNAIVTWDPVFRMSVNQSANWNGSSTTFGFFYDGTAYLPIWQA